MRNQENQENRNASLKRKRKACKIRPLPIFFAGVFIDALLIGLATFCLGSLAYFFQWKIAHFAALAAIVYLTAIYLSALLVSLIAGHRYPLLPLGNGLICLALSIIPLAVNGIPVTENLLTKIILVSLVSFGAYLTVKLLNAASAPKRTRQRIPIAERTKTIDVH